LNLNAEVTMKQRCGDETGMAFDRRPGVVRGHIPVSCSNRLAQSKAKQHLWGARFAGMGDAEHHRSAVASHKGRARSGKVIDLHTAANIKLDLLRGFVLRHEDQTINLPVSAQRLLAYLALSDRPIMRRKVAGVLWSETTDQRSTANLRSSLWRLNRPGLSLVDGSRSHLSLSPAVRVDVREVVDLAHDLLGGTERSSCDFDPLCSAGELLPDWYEDWVLVERERLRQLRLHALEALADMQVREGHYAEAAEVAFAAVSTEPLRESAQRALIRVHIAEGNFGEAMRQYRNYSELLFEEMGVGPSPQLESMIECFNR
jgi:DNA-binding SARP family transcriptional activator